MKAPDVKPGMTVSHATELYTVLDKAPGPEPWSEEQVRVNLSGARFGTRKDYAPSWFWLHPVGNASTFTSAHAREFDVVEDPYEEARRKRRRKALV